MTCKTTAAAAAALVLLCVPAQAETTYIQISPSIILMGEPAPETGTETEAEAEAETALEDDRRRLPDVLADGERREAGIRTMPVAEDEQTSSVPDEADQEPDSENLEPAPAPLEGNELRPLG